MKTIDIDSIISKIEKLKEQEEDCVRYKYNSYDEGYTHGYTNACDDIIDEINKPIVQNKGKWIKTIDTTAPYTYECSICKHRQINETNFCPDCGALMEDE